MCCCEGGMCKKCCGMSMALLGVLLLINAFVWPRWVGFDGWVAFGSVLLIFAGVAKSFFPQAPCCKAACGGSSCESESHPAPASKKSKK